MSRIDDIFAELRRHGSTALMPFLTAGYPSLEETEAAIPVIAEAGASIIELGIPFSDPIADGPVIAASMHDALLSGVSPAKVFDSVRRVRSATSAGLVAMVSYSVVARMGVHAFVGHAADAGFDGLILPDIDSEAASEVAELTDARDLSFSLLIAPTTPEQRIRELVRLCRGFVYVLARVGITGEREAAPQVADRVATLREYTDLPLAVGFGIASAAHVRAVTATADAAIVGTALVRRMGETATPAKAAGAFVSELATGLEHRPGSDQNER